jgi:hypothetical protein
LGSTERSLTCWWECCHIAGAPATGLRIPGTYHLSGTGSDPMGMQHPLLEDDTVMLIANLWTIPKEPGLYCITGGN